MTESEYHSSFNILLTFSFFFYLFTFDFGMTPCKNNMHTIIHDEESAFGSMFGLVDHPFQLAVCRQIPLQTDPTVVA